MLDLVKTWTSAFALIGLFLGVESASLRFYHGSLSNFTITPVEEPLRILPFFDKTLVSVFYIFGFNGSPESADSTLILSAYLTTGYTNVVLVDWSNEARASPGGALLAYPFRAVPNSRLVGRKLGRALVTYIQNGISENKIHVVGHSLGAHVAGYAGEFVKECDLELVRITGLDPAGPLFEGILNSNGLNPTRAKFVDVLHTNPGQYGIRNSIGNVDFWANCANSIQPGCPYITQISDDSASFCSHRRSYIIFSDAIISPTSYPAARADNCASWQYQKNSSQNLYLGDFVNTWARGNYFFSTNSEEPFSQGQAGTMPN